MTYFTYVLVNREGETYVGHTNDLSRRLAEHNDPQFRGTLHTKRRKGPWRLVFKEQWKSRSEAMRRERELKTGKGREFIKSRLTSGD